MLKIIRVESDLFIHDTELDQNIIHIYDNISKARQEELARTITAPEIDLKELAKTLNEAGQL